MSNNLEILLGKHSGYGNLFVRRHTRIEYTWSLGNRWSLGKLKNDVVAGDFSELLENPEESFKVFETLNFQVDDWWTIMEMFAQAYAIQKAAEVYYYGAGVAIRENLDTKGIRCDTKHYDLNSDLETLLDRLWQFMEEKMIVG